MNQEEPEEITYKSNHDPLIRHGDEDQTVDLTNGLFPKYGAEKEEHWDGENRLLQESMVMGYLTHQAPFDVNGCGGPKIAAMRASISPKRLPKEGTPACSLRRKTTPPKGQDQAHPFAKI